jgi:hypothetical protein
MELARQFFRLMILGAIDHQVTHVCVVGSIFEDTREQCNRINPRLGQLVTCHLCFGTWIGFLLALLFRPGLLEPKGRRLPLHRPPTYLRVAAFFADAFAIALAGRFFTEALAILAGQAAVKREQEQLLEAQLEGKTGSSLSASDVT